MRNRFARLTAGALFAGAIASGGALLSGPAANAASP